MPRQLTTLMDQLQLNAQRRQPGFLVEVFDIRSTDGDVAPTGIGDVVVFNVNGAPALPAIVGPRDFTGDVETIRLSEVAGDFVDKGIAANTADVRIQDPSAELDPLTNPPTVGDPTADGRWLRQGNVLVIREGDAQVPQAEWPITFTGRLVGQPGQNRNRTSKESFLTVAAVGREEEFLGRENTSRLFEQSATYRDMVEDIAQADMNMDLAELNFPASFGNEITCHLSTQFVEESPLVSIANILFVTGELPRFEGDGRLGLINGLVTKAPARVYTDDQLVDMITRPLVRENGTNVMRVVGLSCDLDTVVQDRQELATASITTGFFASNTDIPVKWSTDATQQAKNTQLDVIHSVGSGLFSFGSESYSENTDVDGSAVDGTIQVDGGLALNLVAIIAGFWLTSHFIPDGTTSMGGPTIPIGRLVESTVGQILFTTISTQARGQYRVTGEPLEHVYLEVVGESVTGGVDGGTDARREATIENGLITTQADVDSASLRVLTRERKKQNARQVRMIHDLALVPDDIFQTADGTRLMIRSISRTLQRGGDHRASLECFEVTPGVRP